MSKKSVDDIGHIRTLKNRPGTYFVDVCWGAQRHKIYRDRSGRFFDSKRSAARFLERIRSEIEDGSFIFDVYRRESASNYRFDAFAEKWLEKTSPTLSPATVYNRKYMIRKFCVFFGKNDLKTIKNIHISDFLESRNMIELSDNSRRTVLKTLRALFGKAYQWEIIPRPFSFPVIPERVAPVEWITVRDQIRILRRIKPGCRPVFRFLFLTGCRPGEARALKWDTIDFRARIIIIKRTFSRTEVREETKAGGFRVLPMTDKIYRLLVDQRKHNLGDCSNIGFVFLNPQTGRHFSAGIGRIWNTACRRAGIKIKMYNGTRHSFFTQRMQAGWHKEDLQAIAGHSSVKTTERYAKTLINGLIPVMNGEINNKIISLAKEKNLRYEQRKK